MARPVYDLTQELDELRSEMHRVFATPIARPWFFGDRNDMRWMPAMDCVAVDDELRVTLDLPGLRREDVDVQIDEDVLVIRGERSIDREESGEDWYRRERSSGRFERSLQLPAGIDPDAVHATFEQGVLHVSVPLPAARVATPRHVQIEAGDAG